MSRGTALGVGLCVAGLLGYAAGVVVEYPGRAFSLTALMAGIALVTIAHREDGSPA